MSETWTVSIIGQAKKFDKNVKGRALNAFILLRNEMKLLGPNRHNWPNYGKISGSKNYHCHLVKGRPTYVACWSADKENKIIEVYYVGTHENAPY